MASNQNSPSPIPLLQGLLPFDRTRLVPDIMAGITLAALGIPEVMGYTKINGTPVITGLYTLLLPVVAFAIFGSSRHLVVSADSATAAMVAAALTTLSFIAYTPKYVALTTLVGLVSAGLLLLGRILRLGFSPIFSPARYSLAFSLESAFRLPLANCMACWASKRAGMASSGNFCSLSSTCRKRIAPACSSLWRFWASSR